MSRPQHMKSGNHAEAARAFLERHEYSAWHDEALWYVRQKRDAAAQAVPDWEALREQAARIKRHTLAHLDEYLAQFEAGARRHGIEVHRAATAEEHNRIVHDILSEAGARRVVKSKSMLTEECGLNEFLSERGIEVIDTDLGERIVQLRREPPSHIVMPAIHLKKEEIGELFHERLGTEAGCSDPVALTEAARRHLRRIFLEAEAGITGVNFAVAETGGVVVCTNEGNADLTVSLPPLHIACVGIEKLIPRAIDLGVFTRLLARSGTGQPVTTYTSHFHGPRRGGRMHVVLVDNGRRDLLARPAFHDSLACIRCGACLNTCPVYRRSGGFSYGYTIPGPIGSVLAPARDLAAHASLPFASSLCGSCADVCPVRIDLHHQLLAWRGEVVAAGGLAWPKRWGMRLAGWALGSRLLYEVAGRCARLALRLPRPLLYHGLNPWGRQRELPTPPRESFRDWLKGRDGMGEPASVPAYYKSHSSHVSHASHEAGTEAGSPLSELPAREELAACGPQWPDLVEKFREVLTGVGGRLIEARDLAEAGRCLREIYPEARVVCSTVVGIGDKNYESDYDDEHEHKRRTFLSIENVIEPHDLAGVELAIAAGELAVAENGAVWISDAGLPHRALLFIAQHLALIVPRAALVPTLHQAYARLAVDASLFGVFISGPSKTADIEQCLVLGAHGPRTLTVVLL